MADAFFIAGDWGTTSLRLHLCTTDDVLDSRSGPGIAMLDHPPGQVLSDLTMSWRAKHGAIPIYLVGQVGSSLGWREAPYVACPVDIDGYRNACTRFRHDDLDVCIAGGLSCTSPMGGLDYLRGEETQIFGAMITNPELQLGRQLIVLPGTHTKWVLVENGRVMTFHTSLTGELFGLLTGHGVLAAGKQRPVAERPKAFDSGFRRSVDTRNTDLVHSLFEARAHQVNGSLDPGDAAAWLSGMIVGRDVTGALQLFRDEQGNTPAIVIIGASPPTAAYARALAHLDIDATCYGSNETVIAGLRLFRGNGLDA